MLVVPVTVIWPGSLIAPLAVMIRFPPTCVAGALASRSMVEAAFMVTLPLPVVVSVPTQVLPVTDCCVTEPVPVVDSVERYVLVPYLVASVERPINEMLPFAVVAELLLRKSIPQH